MRKRKELSFFQRLVLSIKDFRFYPYMLKVDTFWKSFRYFACLIAILSFFIACYFSSSLFGVVHGVLLNYNSSVPDFTMRNGVLDVAVKDSYSLGNRTILVIDSSKTNEEYLKSEDYQLVTKYDTRMFINSDGILFETFYGTSSQLMFSNDITSFDKETLHQFLSNLDTSFSLRLLVFFSVYCVVFLIFFIMKIIEVVFLTIFTSLVAMIYRIKIPYFQYFKIIFYIITLPYIVETVSILIVGAIKDYTVIASSILEYIYIFYAIRAVKLDAFLLIVSNRDNNDGGKNT